MTYDVRAIEEQFDRSAVADVIHRERLARDNGFFDEMASYYHPNSFVDISWFQGSGAEFVARSKANYRNIDISLHVLSPSIVIVKNDRAIAETPCINRAFFKLDGVDVSREGFTRLLWRAQKQNGKWLIAGLRCYYIRDSLIACNPNHVPKLDEARLTKSRLAYRYLDYTLASVGLAPRDDMAGADRPETVTAMRENDLKWLEEG